jgi:hypothetical protein
MSTVPKSTNRTVLPRQGGVSSSHPFLWFSLQVLFWLVLFGVWCVLAGKSVDRLQGTGLTAVLPLGLLTIFALALTSITLIWALLRSALRRAEQSSSTAIPAKRPMGKCGAGCMEPLSTTGSAPSSWFSAR